MLLHELGRDTWTVLAIARSQTECELKHFCRLSKSIMTTSWSKLTEAAERKPASWAQLAWLQFTEELLALMTAQNVTRAELARRVGVSPAYITKVFRGTVNLTLETMSRLALAVGASVRLHVAPTHQRTIWHDVAIAKGREDGSRLKRASSGRR
jgi:plasmid maintenance system antidote protein VapI